ncbi:MAG: hypothetical protein H0Z38_08205 [Firmicutes bacterium]|nr:hypothetical protein [Bacillota bacterium]
MKKFFLAVLFLLFSLLVAVVIFAKLGFIQPSEYILALLERLKATRPYIEVYKTGLEYKEGLLNLDDVLKERQAKLAELEEELKVKERELEQWERELKAKEEDLAEAEARLAERKERLVKEEEALGKLDRAAAVYAKMEPGPAAKILLTLEVEEAAAILKHMSEKDITEILPEMPPERAAELMRAVTGS